MEHLPAISITKSPVSSWAARVNRHVHSNRLTFSSDFDITQTAKGTHVELKRKHKVGFQGMVWQSDFDPDAGYSKGDVVRVLNNDDFPDVPLGVWVCVRIVPGQNFTDAAEAFGLDDSVFVRQEDVNYAPQWPEPEDDTARYWELIAPLNNCS